MKRCVLGVDMGSTNTKAIASDLEGRQIAYASRRTQMHSSRRGFYEYDLEEMWESALACLKEVAEQICDWEVCAIGVSSLGETNVLADAEGKPLHRAIAWFDLRAAEQEKRVRALRSDREIYRRTGQFLSPKFGLCKLMWILDSEPELLLRAKHFFSVEDFILHRLSGAAATDASIASRSLCYDIRKRQWDAELLSELGIPAGFFPEVLEGGSIAGTLLPEVARFCGLRSGIPVCTGGHDHACALVASGAYGQSSVLDSMGTSETTICALKTPVDEAQGFANGICCYPHFGQKPYRAITSMQACGASVEWFLRAFGAPEGDVYSSLFREAASADALDTPIYVPYIRGLQENSRAAGAFTGLKDAHERRHMIRALMEGLCFGLRDRLESYERTQHCRFDSLRVVGGLAQSEWFLTVKASALNRPLEAPACTEAAAMGAAMLAGRAVNAIALEDISVKVARRYDPDPALAEIYARKYPEYLSAARFVKQ